MYAKRLRATLGNATQAQSCEELPRPSIRNADHTLLEGQLLPEAEGTWPHACMSKLMAPSVTVIAEAACGHVMCLCDTHRR